MMHTIFAEQALFIHAARRSLKGLYVCAAPYSPICHIRERGTIIYIQISVLQERYTLRFSNVHREQRSLRQAHDRRAFIAMHDVFTAAGAGVQVGVWLLVVIRKVDPIDVNLKRSLNIPACPRGTNPVDHPVGHSDIQHSTLINPLNFITRRK